MPEGAAELEYGSGVVRAAHACGQDLLPSRRDQGIGWLLTQLLTKMIDANNADAGKVPGTDGYY